MTGTAPSYRHSLAAMLDRTAALTLSHLDHVYRPCHWLLLGTLAAIAGLGLYLYYNVYGDFYSEQAQAAYAWLYLAMTVVWAGAKLFRPGPRNWLSPDAVFWLVYTMFHIPYVVLYLTGFAQYSSAAFHDPTAANRAMCVVLLCAVGFLGGYELGAVGRPQPARFEPMVRMPQNLFRGSQVLMTVMLGTAVFAVWVGLGTAILQFGYAGVRRKERWVGAEAQRWINVATVFVPMAVIIFTAASVSCYRRTLKGVFIPILIGMTAGFYLLLGARSELGVLVLPLIFARHYFVRRIRLWMGVPIVVLMIIGFGIIRVGRTADSLAPGAFLEAYRAFQEREQVNPFFQGLAEAGHSIKTVNVACSAVPAAESHWWGAGYFNSILKIIPAPIAGLRSDISPSIWVTLQATGRAGGETAGWGGSMAMEAYLNFGMLGGAAALALLGFVYRRTYDSLLRKPSFLRIVLMLVMLTALSMWARNYSHHFFRPVVWTVLLGWLMWSLFGGAQAQAEREELKRLAYRMR